jgi:hypothetical protein
MPGGPASASAGSVATLAKRERTTGFGGFW